MADNEPAIASNDAQEQSRIRHDGAFAEVASWIERSCEFAVALALLTMVAVISADVFTRSVLGFSLQISDELCGYLLVAATFLSVPVSLAHDAFHRVELVQARLSPRSRLLSRIAFDMVALIVCAVLDWQFIRMELASLNSGSMAPSVLMTPLWIPQLSLVIGMSLVCVLLLGSIAARLRRLKSTRSNPRAA